MHLKIFYLFMDLDVDCGLFSKKNRLKAFRLQAVRQKIKRQGFPHTARDLKVLHFKYLLIQASA
jgi:hypothetical protein